jgi:hypothetical protein
MKQVVVGATDWLVDLGLPYQVIIVGNYFKMYPIADYKRFSRPTMSDFIRNSRVVHVLNLKPWQVFEWYVWGIEFA